MLFKHFHCCFVVVFCDYHLKFGKLFIGRRFFKFSRPQLATSFSLDYIFIFKSLIFINSPQISNCYIINKNGKRYIYIFQGILLGKNGIQLSPSIKSIKYLTQHKRALKSSSSYYVRTYQKNFNCSLMRNSCLNIFYVGGVSLLC